MDKLPREFYSRDTREVARALLGTWLVHVERRVERVGRIVEVEAYLGPHDKAAHSARGLTARNRPMFGPPGHAYVYLIYGMHHCFNVVTEPAGQAAAVLVRAVEPVRNVAGASHGPGRLCRAMHIDRRLNGEDLLGDRLFIAAAGGSSRIRVVRRPRVGVDYAGRWARSLLRYYIRDNPFVSKR
ncbi:MAG: DNA-3-methyladenine glycosylase [Planctomycetales bacterium]|nr:DNA-3-methyladenine glycosylase [Planctomycetales bacterium]